MANETLDWAKANEHLAKVKAAALINSGKENHNPYIWLAANVTDLETAAKVSTSQTKEVYDKILALSLTPDTRVDKTKVEKGAATAAKVVTAPPAAEVKK